MRPFNKVAIIGVGLIGGSIGLAVKKQKVAGEVVGIFRHGSTLKRALRCKAVDRGVLDMAEGVADADLIVICSPVHSIPALAWEAARFAKRGTVITDAGSTKSWIVSEMDRLFKGSPVRFVGSHPMAGSERTGVEAARFDLFKGSPCVVTKTARTDKTALARVTGFWKLIGARVKVLDPAEHDRTVSLVSHLPHLIAFGLADAVPENALQYAAEGFKDTTRVASSDPALWADIFLTNKKELLKAAAIFRKCLGDIVTAVERNDTDRVISLLAQAKLKRDIFLKTIYGNKKK